MRDQTGGEFRPGPWQTGGMDGAWRIAHAYLVVIVACYTSDVQYSRNARGRGPRHRPDSTMHPHELTDGIEHVMIESQSHAGSLSFLEDNCGHVDTGDVIRAKQQPTEELQRTEEHTKADNRLRPNLRPLRAQRLPRRAHVPMTGRAGHTRLGTTPSVGHWHGGGRCPDF
jgi:hypothetical protein